MASLSRTAGETRYDMTGRDILIYAATATGPVKYVNEDYYCVNGSVQGAPEVYRTLMIPGEGRPMGLAAVADGVSSSGTGALASEAACALIDVAYNGGYFDSPEPFDWAMLCHELMSSIVRDASFSGDKQTTVSLACFDENTLFCYNIGDSPILLFRKNGSVKSAYTEHNAAGEKRAYNASLTGLDRVLPWKRRQVTDHDEYVLTRCLRTNAAGNADPGSSSILSWEEGDILLIASDGVTKKLTTEEMTKLLEDGSPAEALVRSACDKGGTDNMTAVVLINGGGEGSGHN